MWGCPIASDDQSGTWGGRDGASYRDPRPSPGGPALLALAASATLFALFAIGLRGGPDRDEPQIALMASFDLATPPEPEVSSIGDETAERAPTRQAAQPIPPLSPQPADAEAHDARGAPPVPLPSAPVPEAPAAPVPAARRSEPAGEDALAAYTAQLRRSILARRPARMTGEGEVGVKFRVGRDGVLIDSAIERGSGSVRLDRMALRMVRQAAPFPAPDPVITDAQLVFSLPIRFH